MSEPIKIAALDFETVFNIVMGDAYSASRRIWLEPTWGSSIGNFGASIGGTLTAIPLELLSSLQNILKLPFVALAATVKIGSYTLGTLVYVVTLGHFNGGLYDTARPLPGITDVILTAYKVVAFALGALFTATFGLFISTQLNYQLHKLLGLVNPSYQGTSEELDQLKKDQAARDEMINALSKSADAHQEQLNISKTINLEHEQNIEELSKSEAAKQVELDVLTTNYPKQHDLLEEQRLCFKKWQNTLARITSAKLASIAASPRNSRGSLQTNHLNGTSKFTSELEALLSSRRIPLDLRSEQHKNDRFEDGSWDVDKSGNVLAEQADNELIKPAALTPQGINFDEEARQVALKRRRIINGDTDFEDDLDLSTDPLQ